MLEPSHWGAEKSCLGARIVTRYQHRRIRVPDLAGPGHCQKGEDVHRPASQCVTAALVGLVGYLYCRFVNPAFFKKQTLTRATPTLVPDE